MLYLSGGQCQCLSYSSLVWNLDMWDWMGCLECPLGATSLCLLANHSLTQHTHAHMTNDESEERLSPIFGGFWELESTGHVGC